MPSVQDHYKTHLAPVYVWMAGGLDAAIARGETEIDAVLPNLSTGYFQRHMDRKADAILCMGDTLTHLTDSSTALELFALAKESLSVGGKFITTFRDYSSPLLGQGRFIPVKSDADRILTCFLEYGPDTVDVHDVLHQREGSTWNLRVSVYRKLRLSPEWVCSALRAQGFSVSAGPGLAGMVRVVATWG